MVTESRDGSEAEESGTHGRQGALPSRARSPVYSGVATYHDAFPNVRETEPRIYVESRLQGLETSFLALLDTGAHYCILSPDFREAVEAGIENFT